VPVGKKNTSLQSLKKEVGSGSISESYGSRDPDPNQNVTDPQHWQTVKGKKKKGKYDTQRYAQKKRRYR
jgi:hypothetical protein